MKLAYRSEKNAEAVARFWGKSLEKPDWYRIEAKETDETAEIIIYDVIGWPFNDAYDLIKSLSNYSGSKINLRINSPGGDVFDGMAIFNALKDHSAKVTAKIEGLAASMASVIALAGDEVQAHKNSMYMIHEPWTVLAGNQYEMREVADILQKIGGNILDVYADNSKIGKRELKQMMKDETWFTAKEAKERGLIDTVIDSTGTQAKFDLSIFSNVPESISETPEKTEREKEKALRYAGFSRTEAKAILAGRKESTQRDAEEVKAELDKLIKILR